MPAALKTLLSFAVPLLLIGGLVLAIVYWAKGTPAGTASGQTWTCSMHPQVRLPQPGQCPICGMTLIPVEELASGQASLARLAGLETEPVAYRELFKEVRTVGKLDYSERRVAYITARIDGRVDRVFADVTGIRVKEKDHLVSIYSPLLYTAQSELLQALKEYEQEPRPRFAESGLQAVRKKLALLGILPEQLEEIEKTREASTHLTIFAPIGGTVIEKNVREGQYVEKGDMLYRIADLDPIWLYLDIYESDLGWVRYGQGVEVTLEAYPGERFAGKVIFIDPFLNDETRTVKVRVNLANPDQRLKPAMYASAAIKVRLRSDGTPEPTGLEGKYICPMHPEVVRDETGDCPICGMDLDRVPGPTAVATVEEVVEAEAETPPAGKVLAIPASAVLDTGTRKIAYRKAAKEGYELVELVLGARATARDAQDQPATFYPVLRGLSAGDEVVTRGGFLVDSQRQIEGLPSVLYPEGRSAASLHAGHGGGTAPPDTAPATGGHQH